MVEILNASMMSLIQAPLSRASATERRLRRLFSTAAVRSGAHSSRHLPSSQGSAQNSVSLPSPTTYVVDALKNTLEILSTTTRSPDHGLDLSHRCNHSQCSLSDIPMNLVGDAQAAEAQRPLNKVPGHRTLTPLNDFGARPEKYYSHLKISRLV
jgi:hypothetical protein